MALARKGLRTVRVGSAQYEWLIRKKATYSQGAFATPLHIAVQQAGAENGRVLIVSARISRPDNWIRPHQTSVTPSMVRSMVEAALAAGWKPTESGSAFLLEFPLIRDRT